MCKYIGGDKILFPEFVQVEVEEIWTSGGRRY